jgi:hypothetical protein
MRRDEQDSDKRDERPGHGPSFGWAAGLPIVGQELGEVNESPINKSTNERMNKYSS